MAKESTAKVDEQIAETAKAIPQYQLLMKVPGFGPLTTAYLIALLASGTLAISDSFVAFIGLDPRVRESGKLKGKRKLSKRGDPEDRRLLYLAAFAACRVQGPFRDMYDHYTGRGFSKTEATVIVARTLARVAWSIHKRNQPYIPGRVRNQLAAPAHSDPGSRTKTNQRVVEPPNNLAQPHVSRNKTHRKRGITLDGTT